MRNPFRFGSPVSSPDEFFGREQVVDEMLSLVAQGQPCSLVGERRVGKTSLLLHFAHPSSRAFLEAKMGPVLIVYLDFQGHKDLTVETFWRVLAREAIHQAEYQSTDGRVINLLNELQEVDKLDISHIRRSVAGFAQAGTRLLLLLDEFEYLADSNALDLPFFGGLRSLVASNLPVTCITASRKSLSEIDRFMSGYSFVSSPFFNVFITFPLGTFEEREAKALLTESLRETGAEFDADDISFLNELSGYHPFFLQMAAYYLFEESRRQPQVVGRDRRLAAQARFDKQCNAHFDYYWMNSTDAERTVLTAYALDRERIPDRTSEAHRMQLETTVRSLVDRALLAPSQTGDGSYRLVSTSLAEWIRETALTEVRPRVVHMKPESFKQLPRDGVRFEELVLQLLEAMGYHVLEKPLRDTGSKPDILAERITTDRATEEPERVAVECKHYAHSGQAVSSRDVDGWRRVISDQEATGYLLITDSRVTENLARLFRTFTQDEANYPRWAEFWDVDRLIAELNKYPDVRDTFFPLEKMSQYAYVERPSRIFIVYKWHVDPDQGLAVYLHDFLAAQGCDIFVDTTIRTSTTWLDEMDRQIKASDFLIVLLSKESADSEMVQAEVKRAYQYRKLQGHPRILPVRVAHEGLLPYSIDVFLDPLHCVVWQSDVDNERVGRDILAAIEGQSLMREPIQLRPVPANIILSEDGRLITDSEPLHPPLPKFDSRWLEELEAPGGAVRFHSRFYVERDADARLRREITRLGTTITIRAARQTGKSSLLVRGLHHARQNEIKAVTLDLQRVDSDNLASPDVFLRYLAEFIVRKLRLESAEVERLWHSSLGPQDKLTYLMEDYVLPESDTPIVLALDEADRLLATDFYTDFFALIRSWHNSRALDDQWNKLNIVMVISTEPYLLIADVSQSPFNVGLRLYLQDFDEAQMRDLNQRHGSPVEESDLSQLMQLLCGHPYLTRKALYTLVTEQMPWLDLVRAAPSDGGPFGDHLRHYHWLLRDEPDLRAALRQIIHQSRCADDMAFFRLLQAGLVKGSGDICQCRCDLYRMYFEDKL